MRLIGLGFVSMMTLVMAFSAGAQDRGGRGGQRGGERGAGVTDHPDKGRRKGRGRVERDQVSNEDLGWIADLPDDVAGTQVEPVHRSASPAPAPSEEASAATLSRA